MAELLRLRKGVPEIVSLAYADGKEIASQRPDAPPSIMFTLVDGRRTFLPVSAAEQIRRAGITARVPMEIVKLAEDEYQIRCLGGGAASTAPSATTTTTHQNSNAPAPTVTRIYTAPAAAPQADASFSPASARLMACLKGAIDAAIEAEAYAERQGLELRFSSEDIRTMANTLAMNGGVR